ncbi:AAA family ATPase [Actinoplanes sp. RD1]|uniref:AAA family ATPase n=1 Tax=Actinoplanes sp. RD1 TaxID=3064538 RepID=UPI00274288B7|nr:AAA family ATPase [Actinoplanes sp. RD1]
MTRVRRDPAPVLTIIRGNSGSGKTTAAREIRRRYGRGCALLEQDHLRRIILREHDHDGGAAPAFIAATARSALGLGYHVVLEGILYAKHYRAALESLIAGHPGPSHVYYLDIPFEETLRRHATRPGMAHITEAEMRGWYAPSDALGVPGETVFGPAATLEAIVTTVLHRSGLAAAAPLAPCPVTCPRCSVQAEGVHLGAEQ